MHTISADSSEAYLNSRKFFIDTLELGPFGLLNKHIGRGAADLQIVGGQSELSLSLFVSQFVSRQQSLLGSHLIIVSNDEQAQKVKDQIQFFNPNLIPLILPGFDVSPYSNLYPSTQKMARRLGWLHMAQNPHESVIFIAPILSLLQRTLPFDVLANNSFHFQVGDELPDNMTQLLSRLGYSATPYVEDIGTFSFRGGILDLFSPAQKGPLRIELFGNTIESLRYFDPSTQRSEAPAKSFYIIPAKEILFTDENKQQASIEYKNSILNRNVDSEESQQVSRQLAQGHYFHGLEFLIPHFYKSFDTPMSHFCNPLIAWQLGPLDLTQHFDSIVSTYKKEQEMGSESALWPDYKKLYLDYDKLFIGADVQKIHFTKIHIEDLGIAEKGQATRESTLTIPWPQSDLIELQTSLGGQISQPEQHKKLVKEKLSAWKEKGYSLFVACPTQNQQQRLKALFESLNYEVHLVDETSYEFQRWVDEQSSNPLLIHILPRTLYSPLRLNEEQILFLRDEDFLGRKISRSKSKTQGSLRQRGNALSFGDLKPGDFVVHKLHGIGVYLGLEVMPIQGVDSEFIQIEYKGKDKLFLPVYRVGQIQKYSGPSSPQLIDKLGGTGWAKTQTKVRASLKDIASELLKLYAERARIQKPPFSEPNSDFNHFENAFPYDETEDQLKAINDVITDLISDKPMDRLVCGDVGFGKTEVAMRAAFKVVQDGLQVAIIAPTTILTFQHLQTLRKRYKGWPFRIEALNRFVNKSDQAEIVKDLGQGKVDIVVGTHRLFSKDIQFKNLGLLVIDEEQKFGVKHKEKIRRLKKSVDTLAMSATPIPRTLNLSLMGIRDLSIINTPPVDRLPTRTFVCKFDPETIRKAVDSEIERGGQVFFLHNRVNSIYALHDELKDLLPHVKMAVAHGQMPEAELEKVMLSFFNHEIDMLICTTIIESGMDIPKANTMFIDNAHQLGLSQLYQLRGRVGRSKTRAYCYLLIPRNRRLDALAQERLKVIQENTALGSGIQIAHYDLELRGAGDILGEDQSGNINAVGYELYLELLENQIRSLRGEPIKEELEPEINLKVKALIPDSYISDIRIRLSYYKALSEIESEQDIDQLEEDLRDQFGAPPEAVLNLLGIMLIRKFCKDLCVKDISTGKVGVSLMFTDKTPLSVEKVLKLTQRHDKKYSLAPDNRLICRMKEITWPRVYEELRHLTQL